MSKVIIVNGAPGAGKTQFELFCQEIRGNEKCHILSTIDCVKESARMMGWNGEKTPESRKFLADLKQLMVNAPWGDITFDDIRKKIHEVEYEYHQFELGTDELIFFVDSREAEQIDRFKYDMNAVTVVIRNEQAEKVVATNEADANVLDYWYDFSISNDGSLDELKRKAKVFLNVLNGVK